MLKHSTNPNTRIELLGDRTKAQGLIGRAKSLMGIVHQEMGFQKLKQHRRDWLYKDGVRITCQASFGQDVITIYVEPVLTPSEPQKPLTVTVFFEVYINGTASAGFYVYEGESYIYAADFDASSGKLLKEYYVGHIDDIYDTYDLHDVAGAPKCGYYFVSGGDDPITAGDYTEYDSYWYEKWTGAWSSAYHGSYNRWTSWFRGGIYQGNERILDLPYYMDCNGLTQVNNVWVAIGDINRGVVDWYWWNSVDLFWEYGGEVSWGVQAFESATDYQEFVQPIMFPWAGPDQPSVVGVAHLGATPGSPRFGVSARIEFSVSHSGGPTDPPEVSLASYTPVSDGTDFPLQESTLNTATTVKNETYFWDGRKSGTVQEVLTDGTIHFYCPYYNANYGAYVYAWHDWESQYIRTIDTPSDCTYWNVLSATNFGYWVDWDETTASGVDVEASTPMTYIADTFYREGFDVEVTGYPPADGDYLGYDWTTNCEPVTVQAHIYHNEPGCPDDPFHIISPCSAPGCVENNSYWLYNSYERLDDPIYQGDGDTEWHYLNQPTAYRTARNFAGQDFAAETTYLQQDYTTHDYYNWLKEEELSSLYGTVSPYSNPLLPDPDNYKFVHYINHYWHDDQGAANLGSCGALTMPVPEYNFKKDRTTDDYYWDMVNSSRLLTNTDEYVWTWDLTGDFIMDMDPEYGAATEIQGVIQYEYISDYELGNSTTQFGKHQAKLLSVSGNADLGYQNRNEGTWMGSGERSDYMWHNSLLYGEYTPNYYTFYVDRYITKDYGTSQVLSTAWYDYRTEWGVLEARMYTLPKDVAELLLACGGSWLRDAENATGLGWTNCVAQSPTAELASGIQTYFDGFFSREDIIERHGVQTDLKLIGLSARKAGT